MTLHELGEDGFVRRLQSRFNANLPNTVLSGIGDDCAVVSISEDQAQLITCDMLVEGIHFRMEQTFPEALGHKSLAVNLSDIAAMGGIPDTAFLSLGIPKSVDIDWLDSFFDGVQKLADANHVLLLGGDLTRSPTVVVNVTIIGKAKPECIRYRNQAVAEDIICTTGYLGNAGTGLKLLQDKSAASELTSDVCLRLTDSLLKPYPHLQKGQWLAQQPAVHAMMDISDGLSADLSRMMEASGVGATINLEMLPLSSELRTAAQVLEWDPCDLATSAGEDYCLLLTVEQNAFPSVNDQYLARFGEPLHEIGHINRGGAMTFLKNGNQVIPPPGFDHFLNSGPQLQDDDEAAT